jgi:hypothetical protein
MQIFLISLLFLIAALPLKNWLEIQRIKKIDKKWSNWLKEKPTREEYCSETNQNIENINCDFCGTNRQLPNLEMVIIHNPKFGIINNKFNRHSYFKNYICTGCGAQLYRERYEE